MELIAAYRRHGLKIPIFNALYFCLVACQLHIKNNKTGALQCCFIAVSLFGMSINEPFKIQVDFLFFLSHHRYAHLEASLNSGVYSHDYSAYKSWRLCLNLEVPQKPELTKNNKRHTHSHEELSGRRNSFKFHFRVDDHSSV